MSAPDLPNAADVWRARSRIAAIVRPTPTLPSLALSEKVGREVFLKWETMHPTGAFKIRGAANKILGLTPEERARGVAAFSTGNHGLSVAYVARKLGIPATVCVSERVPSNKVRALQRVGATVEVYGKSQDEAEAHCYELEGKEGFVIIKPFDDPMVISGQGTIGLELLNQVPELSSVLVPLSGGGLIAGVALAIKANNPRTRVIGVTMDRGAAMYHSLRAGAPVSVEEEDTLADSLLGGIGMENQYTFALVQDLVDETVLVSEDAIARAMTFLFSEHHAAVEGAAAVGPAALLENKVELGPGPAAAVITGNNVDISAFMRAIEPHLK